MVKNKTKELQLRSSTPKKLDKTLPEPTITPRKGPRLIAKAKNNLNSSSRKVILDFDNDHKPTQPTQASVGDNLHVGGSQGIVDLENDEEQARFWTKASTKVTNLEEAFKSMQESVCNLDNWGEDECHPEDAPWTQPLLCSEGEDATKWSEFCNNFKEVGPGGPSVRGGRSDYGDQEGNSEDDGYEKLLETDDEAEDWFYDYEDIFGEDPLDNEELFPEDAGVEQVVEPGLVECGTQYKLKKSGNLRIRAVCKKLANEPTFNINGFCLEHTCIGDPLGRNSSVNPEFVVQYVIEKLKTSTSSVLPKPAEITNDFWTSHNTLIPYHVAWKARNIVLEKINGSYDESYKLVPSLCEMIKRTNPGSIAKFTYGRQKGLLEALALLFPGAPRRFCIRYCSSFYTVDNFRTTYAPTIAPLLGPDDWEETTIVINAPILMRKPGRPRVNRRRSYDEPQIEKKPRACSKCKQTGHNKTTCGGGAVGSNPKVKRLRTEVYGQTFTSINYNHGQSRTGKCKKNGNNNINLVESSQSGGSLSKTKKAKKNDLTSVVD
ncbi:hypothetical protein MKW92_038631 [Papaver armeniacum]|nr:hypothetical protein MKW92_038631 [Papaver armeniacum]